MQTLGRGVWICFFSLCFVRPWLFAFRFPTLLLVQGIGRRDGRSDFKIEGHADLHRVCKLNSRRISRVFI